MKNKLFKALFVAVPAVFALTACLNDTGAGRNDRDAHLIIQTQLRDVNKVNGLAKSQVITLGKLVVTLTSDDPADAVIRDTVYAADTVGSLFTSNATVDQVFSRNYLLKPLRSWAVVVKTLDANDSVIHYDSVLAANILAGEVRPISISLASRFVMYEAKFSLPDSLSFTQLNDLKQELNIRRVVMIVDGDTVADSSSAPRFNPSTVHTVRFDYIDVNSTPDVKIEFYGSVGIDSTDKKLFEYLFEDVDPTVPSPTPVEAVYTGPNSTQLGGSAGLTINIGKVGTVVFEPVINPEVTTKRSAE